MNPKMPDTTRRDAGLIEYGLLLAMTVLMIGMTIAGLVVANIARGSASVDTTLKEQRADAAISDAVARLSSDQPVGSTRATAQVACADVSNRSVCFQYWALPVPGNATEPLLYDLVVQTWVDKDHDGQPPTGPSGVRAVKVRLSAVTYQTGAGVDPQVSNGQIQYVASPPGPLSSGLFGFRSVTLAGPDVSIGSFNAITGGTAVHTGAGTVASDGPVVYGSGVKVDHTLLYGTPGTLEDTTSRCTGEPCGESDVTTRDEVYRPADDAATTWMNSLACTQTIAGDWVASQHGGLVPAGTTCVNGALVIDVPTSMSVSGTKLVVRGNVDIAAPLNAPSAVENPNTQRLAIYSSGKGVAFRPAAYGAGPLVVAGVIYAPQAACTADPASAGTDASSAGSTVLYGAMACDTVSLGGSFTQLQDDASLVTYTDPVPGARKAWSVGGQEVIEAAAGAGNGQWDSATGWGAGTCVMPGPVNAMAYWRLLEPSGTLAADSAGGTYPLTWRAGNAGRTDGICGRAAALDTSATAQVSGTATLVSPTAGVSLEWWGKGAVSSGQPVVRAAGVTVSVDADHITASAGAASFKFPFTVQHDDSWHLYTVSVSNTGAATLYVDGQAKETGTLASPSAGGPTVLAKGTAGAISDVVVYSRVLSAAEVSTRWAAWNANVVFTPSDPGTPFTAPGQVVDAGTTPTLLTFTWTAATGTLPPAGSGSASYSVQRATAQAGTYSQLGTVALSQTSFSQSSPAAGSYWYRACTEYNGDEKCGAATNIVTVPPPTPVTVTANNAGATTTTVSFSWPAQQYATSYEYQSRINGGTWSSVTPTTATSVTITSSSAAKVEIQVRVVNPAGTSAWSTIATGYLVPPAPSASAGTVTTTTAAFSWTSAPNVLRYEFQYRVNGGAWSGVNNNGTATTWTAGPTTQGSKIEIQARAVNPAGLAGAWSNIPLATLQIVNPNWNSWGRSDSYPAFYSWVYNTNGTALCPAGTSVYTIFRDGIQNSFWNGWTGPNSNGGSSATYTYGSWIQSYSAVLQTEIQGYCQNDASGVRSSGITAGITYAQHPLSAPWGLGAQAGSPYRTATWWAACPQDASPVYNVTISAAWGSWNSGWTTGTSYARTGSAWGRFTITVYAYCTSGGVNSGQSGGAFSGGA